VNGAEEDTYSPNGLVKNVPYVPSKASVLWPTQNVLYALKFVRRVPTLVLLTASSASKENTLTQLEVSHLMTASTAKKESSANRGLQNVKHAQQVLSEYIKKQCGTCDFFVLIAIVKYFLLFKESGAVLVATASGEKEIIELPDGSTVKLNAGSEITYLADGWDDERTLQLKGEAFFQVKKGSDFQVVTPTGTVTVLGTSFNVRARGEATEVICYTGKVRVQLDTVLATLTPGNAIRVSNEAAPVRWDIDGETEAKWISGVVDLYNVTLTDALHELEITYGIKADYSNVSDDTSRYMIPFPMDNLEVATQMVLTPFGLEGTFDANKKTLTVDYK
jgi:ferric-dicitrate binding protein FerR (iron transport regulator)